MRDIDLIPSEHLHLRSLQRWLMRAGGVAGALLALTLVGRLAIELNLARARPQVDQLQQSSRALVEQRKELVALNLRQAALQTRLDQLQALRRPAPWGLGLHSVDQAFGAGLWLDELSLQTHAVAPPQDAALATGAAPTAPIAPSEPGASAVPRTEQRLTIKGHAIDHAGVMTFIRQLREQPALQGVRLVDTAVRRYATSEVIDFSVTARVEPPATGASR